MYLDGDFGLDGVFWFGAAPHTDDELDKRELAFVEDFYKLLRAAYFNIISREDWETAQDENFTVRTVIRFPSWIP